MGRLNANSGVDDTTSPQRVRGYCALPLLCSDRVMGWGFDLARAYTAVCDARLQAQLRYVTGHAPRDAGATATLQNGQVRMAVFQAPDHT